MIALAVVVGLFGAGPGPKLQWRPVDNGVELLALDDLWQVDVDAGRFVRTGQRREVVVAPRRQALGEAPATAAKSQKGLLAWVHKSDLCVRSPEGKELDRCFALPPDPRPGERKNEQKVKEALRHRGAIYGIDDKGQGCLRWEVRRKEGAYAFARDGVDEQQVPVHIEYGVTIEGQTALLTGPTEQVIADPTKTKTYRCASVWNYEELGADRIRFTEGTWYLDEAACKQAHGGTLSARDRFAPCRG